MKRVLSVEFAHETNTFCILPTTIENFERQCYLKEESEVKKYRIGTRTSLGATFEAAEKYNWLLSTPISASSNPTGKVTNEAYEELVGRILAPILKIKQSNEVFDGILYHLHGAMVSESYEDAEGELLRRTRNLVGSEIPILVTLDLHGNITKQMSDMSSALIAVRTYPHIDAYERAWQAAELLEREMNGQIRLKTVIAKRPMLKGLDGGKTQFGPMRVLLDRGEEIEKRGEKVMIISICAGFTAADIYDIGPSVTVSYDMLTQHEDDAKKIAEDFMDYAWEMKEYVSSECLSINQVIQKAKEDKISNQYTTIYSKPLIIADITDNPGSGHYGDATDLLAEVVKAKLSDVLFYAIYDPIAVKQGIAIGIGKSGFITLGGRHDVNAGGGPIELFGKVVTLSDGIFQAFGPMGNGVWQNFGLSMLFRVNEGIDIAVISNNGQLLDISQITSLGVDPCHKQVIVVKSKHHFRASLEPICREILLVDGGGLGSVILNGGKYIHVRRPIWPLDPI